MHPEIEATARELVDRFEADGRTELKANYCMKLPLTIIGRMLGVPEYDHVKIEHLMEGFAIAFEDKFFQLDWGSDRAHHGHPTEQASSEAGISLTIWDRPAR